MKLAVSVLAWLFFILFTLMAVALYFMGAPIPAVLMAVAALFVLPPFWRALKARNFELVGSARAFVVVVILVGMSGIIAVNPATSIYRSQQVQQDAADIYRDKLAKWPVPVEETYVDTSFGRIHVLVAGPEDAPPVLLVHASALAAWSWLPNIEALAETRRVYAPDNIGEIGLNQYVDLENIPSHPTDVAGFLEEVTTGLGIEKADIVGASIGGYIATTYALEKPERVGKLALLGSMGYGDTTRTVALMTLSQAYPLPVLQDWTLGWALGESEAVAEEFGDWFRLVLNGTLPKPIPPSSFTPERLRTLSVPTLAVFGSQDGVIGSADDAVALAGHIPDVETMVVDSGHLIGAEVPDIANAALVDFLS